MNEQSSPSEDGHDAARAVRSEFNLGGGPVLRLCCVTQEYNRDNMGVYSTKMYIFDRPYSKETHSYRAWKDRNNVWVAAQ